MHNHHDQHDPTAARTTHLALLQAIVLLGLAGFVTMLLVSGSLANYITNRFGLLTVVAIAGFCILGLSSLARVRHPAASRGQNHVVAEHDHLHRRITWGVVAIVALPLAVGILVPSRPLGASAVGGDLSSRSQTLESIDAVTSDSLQWTILDWLRVFHFGGDPARLKGREADVIGFVFHPSGDPPGTFRLTRFLMNCCSADATALALPVVWAQAEQLPNDTWVRVHGTIRIDNFAGNTLPIVDASSLDQTIGRPREPYLYP